MNLPRTGLALVLSFLLRGLRRPGGDPNRYRDRPRAGYQLGPAQPPVEVSDQIVDALGSRGVSTLLPTGTPDDASETKGRFTILRTVPTGIVTAQVVVEGPDWLLSLSSTAASPDADDCDARLH